MTPDGRHPVLKHLAHYNRSSKQTTISSYMSIKTKKKQNKNESTFVSISCSSMPTVTDHKPNTYANKIKKKLPAGTHFKVQTSLLSFLLVSPNPISQHQSPRAPTKLARHHKLISPLDESTPTSLVCTLSFEEVSMASSYPGSLPSNDLRTTLTPTPAPSQPLLLTKQITQFFPILPQLKQTLRAPIPYLPNIHIKPVSIISIAGQKRQLQHILLTYHTPPSNSTPITKYTTPLPRYELNKFWGHSLSTINTLTTFHLFLQNPYGLSLSFHRLSVQLDFCQFWDYGTAVLCLPETNVNWNSPDQSTLLRNILRHTWQASVSSVSKPPEEFLSQNQPGGTATILCDNWVSLSVGRGEDPMGLGRWSYITLCGKGSKLITIITAYNASYNTGEMTNFRQQQRVLTQLHPLHEQSS